jgi:hypothetical protein
MIILILIIIIILNSKILIINCQKNKIFLNQFKNKILKYNKNNLMILIILIKNKYKIL